MIKGTIGGAVSVGGEAMWGSLLRCRSEVGRAFSSCALSSVWRRHGLRRQGDRMVIQRCRHFHLVVSMSHRLPCRHFHVATVPTRLPCHPVPSFQCRHRASAVCMRVIYSVSQCGWACTV